MADEKQETPASRVAAKVKGLAPHALAEVLAADVLALAAAVPDPARTPATAALARGAATAVKGLPDHLAAERTVHCRAGDLAALLEVAGGDAQ